MPENVQIEATDFSDYQKIRDLINNTNKEKPKQADRAELRRMLETHPQMWRWAGDVARRASDHIIMGNSGKSVYIIESLKRGLEVMREEFGYNNASVIERMLIEQVLICWLRLHLLEIHHCNKTTESHSTETGLYWDRRLLIAQRRFTRATESLAKVRKLISETQWSNKGNTLQNVRLLNAVTGTV